MRKLAKKKFVALTNFGRRYPCTSTLRTKKKTVLIVVLGSNVAKEQLIYPFLEI